MSSELKIEYNFEFGKPKGQMIINLDKLFETKYGKKVRITNINKIMKFILKNGTEENIVHLESWLSANNEDWYIRLMKLKK